MKENKNNIGEQSLQKARALFETGEINHMEVGTVKGVCQIHTYLFDRLYHFAGKIRTFNITKGGLRFANYLYLNAILLVIGKMPESNSEEIIANRVEINMTRPFMKGNGRAARIWLDRIAKRIPARSQVGKRLKKAFICKQWNVARLTTRNSASCCSLHSQTK